ncbi:MAG: hypothetical protein AB7I33_10900 [Gemmatimonadales bacterium]
MPSLTVHRLCAAVAATVLLTACGRDTPTTISDSGLVNGVQPAPLTPAPHAIRARSGTVVDTGVARPIQVRMARALARALSREGVRRRLYQLLHASAFPEHKLRLSDLLRGDGAGLLAAMGAEDGRGGGRVLAALDSLVDFELYLPVPAHWARWNGDDGIIVASVLNHREEPIAFDPRGRRVPGISRDAVPDTPVLALVPVETDFDAYARMERATCGTSCPPPCTGTSCGGSGGNNPPPPDILRLAGIQTSDDHEGWLAGDPEYELYVWAGDQNGDPLLHNMQDPGSEFVHVITTAIAAGCISQYASAPAYWDYDEVGQYVTPSPQPQIYRNLYPDSTIAYDWWLVVTENDDPDHCPRYLPSIGNPAIIYNDDDLVGRMRFPKGRLGGFNLGSFGDVTRLTLSYGP